MESVVRVDLASLSASAMGAAAEMIDRLGDQLAAERLAREELEARIEKASDTLRGHFQQQRYVGTVPFAVVSEALFELAGEEA